MRTFILPFVLLVGFAAPTVVLGQQAEMPAADPSSVTYGVGVRFRGLFVPQRVFERFADVAPSGMQQPEIGLELIRRRGPFEASVGIAWARLGTKEGIWLTDFQDLDDRPSLVEYDHFAWISTDVNAVWKYALDPNVSLRYGLGVGLGFLLGDVLETDYMCPTSRYAVEECRPSSDPVDVRKPVNLPPLVPLTNALVGVQYAPTKSLSINLDSGLHTTIFVGLSVDVFFH